jgi:hypothetical protein
MAIEEITVAVPATTKTTTNLVCDLCGAKARGEEWDVEDEGWRKHYTAVSLTLERREEAAELGSVSRTHYDCCPTCFRGKVTAALEAIGLKPRKVEVSW